MKKEAYPNRDKKYMQEQFGTQCLITDSQADVYMKIHATRERNKKRMSKMIEDAWTI